MTSVDRHSTENPSEENHSSSGGRKDLFCEDSSCAFSYFTIVCLIDSDLRLIGAKRLESTLRTILNHNTPCKCIKIRFGEILRGLIETLSTENISLRRVASQCLRLLANIVSFQFVTGLHLSDFISLVMCYGLSSTLLNVQTAVCTAVPHIFSQELFVDRPIVDVAKDFEPILRCLLELFIRTDGSKSSFKYAYVSLAKAVGKDVYKVIEDMWANSSKCGKLPSANFQLSRRLTSGLFRLSANFAEEPVDKKLSEPIRQTVMNFEASHFGDKSSIAGTSELVSSICFEDMSAFLCRSSFDTLLKAIRSDFAQVDNKCQSNLMFVAEELRERLMSVLSKPEGWRNAFGCPISRNPISNSEMMQLSQSRSFLCLLEVLKRLSEDSNFNVVLCSLDMASMLLDPFRLQIRPLRHSKDVLAPKHPDNSLSSWLVLQFLHVLKSAFSDGKLVVRVAATKLALSLARLPCAPMIVIRNFVSSTLYTSTSKSNAAIQDQFEKRIRPLVRSGSISKHSRLAQEAVDLTTVLMLTLPSAEFNISEVCQLVIQPGLSDHRPLVRVATLDCVAVVAHLLGPGNLGPLLAAVSRAESHLKEAGDCSGVCGGSSLLEAVQRRLVRRQLPQLDSQCRVVRGFSIGASSAGLSIWNGHAAPASIVQDAQNDAVMLTDLEDPANIALRKRAHLMSSAPSSKSDYKGLRRRPSAGLTRLNNRLPWDPQAGTTSASHASSSGVSSSASPRCPESIGSIDRSVAATAATEDSAMNSGHRESQIKSRLDTSRTTTTTASDALESESLPSTSRMSPVPLQPLAADRTALPLRVSQGLPTSNTTSNANTPRGKPVLAPLRRSSSKGSSDLHAASPKASNRSTVSVPHSLLPTRATMGRQSGRSWRTVNAGASHADTVGGSKFGYSATSTSTPQNFGSRLSDSHDTDVSPRVRSRQIGKSSATGSGDAYANDIADEIYDDDYENDDDDDVVDDDDDDDNDDEIPFEDDSSSDSGDRKEPTGRSRSHYALALSKIEAPALQLDNARSLCRSIDSELSEVSSIRSAASHRRAMRLFEEAERKRLKDDEFNVPRRRQDEEDAARTRLQEPLRVSVSEANCAVPVLDPVVVPALPIQGRTAMLSKAVAQRRSTSNNQSALSSLSGPATHVDTRVGHLTESDVSVSTGAKYNPYTGASFRQNPDYSDLVIGRATGLSTTANTPPVQHLSSTPDLHRLAQNQVHSYHERRPLRGQHNIQNLSPNGPHSTPLSDQTAVLPSGHSTTSINVVGKGLFDSPPPPPQQQPQPFTNPALVTKPINGSENAFKPNRPSPSTVPVSEPSVSSGILECTDERQMLGASVVGIGLTESSNSAPPAEKLNISTVEPEAQVSNVFRQRILQKKNKELQKLRKGPTNHEPDESHMHESVPVKTASTKSETAKMQPALGEFEDKAPSVSTWPPAKRNSVSPGQAGKATLSHGSANAAKAPLPPKCRQQTEQLPSKAKSSETKEVTSGSSSPNTQPEGVQSAEAVKQPPGSACGVKSQPTRADERPLVKGKSALNLSLSGPPLPLALQLISSEDWEAKVTGLEQLAQIALDKPSTFTTGVGQGGSVSAGLTRQPTQSIGLVDSLSQTVQAVIAECRNLRSQVSRQAVQTLSSLFQGLGRAMDPHVDLCVRILLGKTGEAAAAFLRDEVTVAMAALTQVANPSRAITAFLQHGLGHKNSAVRLQTALQVAQIVEQSTFRNRSLSKDSRNSTATSTPINSGRISSWSSATNLHTPSGTSNSSVFLSGLMERLVTAASQFLTDGNQETRYHGRRLLNCLIHHSEFEKTVRKQLTGQALRAMRDAIDQIHTRGVGELPNSSASSRRRGFSPAPNASRSRGSSAGASHKS